MAILFDESFQYGLPKTWTKYDGRHPGGNTITTWRSAQVVHVPIRPGIARGRVDLIGQWKNGELVAGGIGRWAGSQLEVNTGFEVTMRANAGNLAICALLMGNGTWPAGGEIDFVEDGGGDRKNTTARLHYGTGWPDHHQTNGVNPPAGTLDLTKWTTMGILRKPGVVIFTKNGVEWGRLSHLSTPTGKMTPTFQGQFNVSPPTTQIQRLSISRARAWTL